MIRAILFWFYRKTRRVRLSAVAFLPRGDGMILLKKKYRSTAVAKRAPTMPQSLSLEITG
ncbi:MULTISPECIES: hypothetical protein [unclassified Leeuwenhoekiella]|uniref:hypothetical protein n=1 Tax=unclassified Leeuwenhoekiella TaxID=2615029 RepID=UPI0025C454C2|nr:MULTISPECIES: hypothetical protein [unclassified Leeuwenhoekiella]|tara:strand:- start:4580 stop:4759 length:180 start_codon:yes stop_codon:yes gene_type:complete